MSNFDLPPSTLDAPSGIILFSELPGDFITPSVSTSLQLMKEITMMNAINRIMMIPENPALFDELSDMIFVDLY